MTKMTKHMLYLSRKTLTTFNFRTENWKDTNENNTEKKGKYDAKWSVTKIRICIDILRDQQK